MEAANSRLWGCCEADAHEGPQEQEPAIYRSKGTQQPKVQSPDHGDHQTLDKCLLSGGERDEAIWNHRGAYENLHSFSQICQPNSPTQGRPHTSQQTPPEGNTKDLSLEFNERSLQCLVSNPPMWPGPPGSLAASTHSAAAVPRCWGSSSPWRLQPAQRKSWPLVRNHTSCQFQDFLKKVFLWVWLSPRPSRKWMKSSIGTSQSRWVPGRHPLWGTLKLIDWQRMAARHSIGPDCCLSKSDYCGLFCPNSIVNCKDFVTHYVWGTRCKISQS